MKNKGKKRNSSRVLGTVFRSIEVARDAVIDEDERLVRISFSSEAPVLRASWFEQPWVEVLGHDGGEMNTARLDAGATLHYNHSRSRADRIGVVESASVKNGRGEAVVRFSKNERVNDIWDDVKDGVLRNVSVGYSIDERTLVAEGGKGEPDEYRVTRWTPHELSFVDIPADHTVGLGRNLEEGTMVRSADGNQPMYRVEPIETENLNSGNDNMKLRRFEGETDEEYEARQAAEDARVAAEEQQRSAAPANTPAPQATPAEPVDEDAIRAQGAQAERTRVSGIANLMKPFARQLGNDFEAIRTHCESEGLAIDAARAYVMDKLGSGQEPVGGETRAQVTETSVQKFVRGANLAIQLRANVLDPKSDEAREVQRDALTGYSLFEMARHILELGGESTGRLGKMELVGRAFTTSDFPLLLLDAANKTMLKGFEEAPETWDRWAQTGDLSDFKIGNRPGLSSFDDLSLVSEDGEFTYGSFTEQAETIQLATYGKLFAITRQAIINDDLSAFTTIPARMGRAASRLVGDLAYGVITSNPLLNDGVALFAAGHNNLNEGPGATALDTGGEAALSAMRTAMALQTDASSNATGLNIRPSHLLVPVTLEDTAMRLMNDRTAPGQDNPAISNRVRNLAEVTSDPRLDADSLTAYYTAASSMFDTIEVAFLDGVRAPVLEQQQGWSIDGTEFKVRLDVGAAPMEFRTWQKNDGA